MQTACKPLHSCQPNSPAPLKLTTFPKFSYSPPSLQYTSEIVKFPRIFQINLFYKHSKYYIFLSLWVTILLFSDNCLPCQFIFNGKPCSHSQKISQTFTSAGLYPSTFVYKRFSPKIPFLYCLLSSVALWDGPMVDTEEKNFEIWVFRSLENEYFVEF